MQNNFLFQINKNQNRIWTRKRIKRNGIKECCVFVVFNNVPCINAIAKD